MNRDQQPFESPNCGLLTIIFLVGIVFALGLIFGVFLGW